jgi:hypothetical protein
MPPPPATLAELPFPSARTERRAWPRFPCAVPASCDPLAARYDRDVSWPGTLRDVSARGVGLVLGRRFEPGTALAIKLPAADASPPCTLLVRVVHVQAQDGNRWLLGCALVGELGADQLEGLRRRGRPEPVAPYHVVPGVVFRCLDGSAGAAPLDVRRLFLKGAWPLAPGTVLKARVRGASPGDDWLTLQVSRCTQAGGRWTVTYTVLGQPPLPALRAFGLAGDRRRGART